MTIKTQIDVTAKTLTFTVDDATPKSEDKGKVIGTIVFDMTKVHADNINYAAYHGFKQRISDKAALSKDPKTGKTISPLMKFEAMKELADFYMMGQSAWSSAREGGGRIGADEVLLAQALGELRVGKVNAEGVTVTGDMVREAVGKMTKDQRNALMQRSDVKVIVDRMRAEAVADIDTDDLMSGI